MLLIRVTQAQKGLLVGAYRYSKLSHHDLNTPSAVVPDGLADT